MLTLDIELNGIEDEEVSKVLEKGRLSSKKTLLYNHQFPVRPDWDLSQLKSKCYSHSMTNTVSHFFIKSREDEDSVVVRVNGVAGFLDRKKELVAFERLSAAGIADKLIATFKNGLVMRPIKGSTLHRDTIKTNEVASHVARAMAQMHKKTKLLATETEPELIRQMRQFISLIPEQYSDVSLHLSTFLIDYLFIFLILRSRKKPLEEKSNFQARQSSKIT